MAPACVVHNGSSVCCVAAAGPLHPHTMMQRTRDVVSSAAAAARLFVAATRRGTHSSAATPHGQAAGIAEAYARLVADGRLQPDATQQAAVQALQLLQDQLKHATAAPQELQQERAGAAGAPPPLPGGAYLWGPVGSGKTMLMDLFLTTLPQQLGVLRLHYHTFMLGIHEQLHALQQSLPRVVARSRGGLPVYRHALPPEDPVLLVARAAAADTRLLCLDEMHVTDVADAMLVGRVFGELLRCGCCLVLTSNRPARDLYKGGLARKYFEPFIKLVDARLLQLRVAGGADYRLLEPAASAQSPAPGRPSPGSWMVGPSSDQQLQEQWQQLVQRVGGAASQHAAAAARGHAAEVGPASIPLPFGRTLRVPLAVHLPAAPDAAAAAADDHSNQPESGPGPPRLPAVLFTFEQLCGNAGSRRSLAESGAMSANDMLALVESCHAIFLQSVPQLQPTHRDEARRLVTLIDLLYDAHTVQPGCVRLVISAAVPPHELFLPLLGAAARSGVNPNLGRAAASRLDVKQLIQGAAPLEPQRALASSAVAGEDAAVGSRQAGAAAAAGAQGVPPALLAEEVLMYHRAASRLAELCAVS